jgi:DNA-binding NarL/FixJ family response regulator
MNESKSPNDTVVRLVLVDDHRMFRSGVKAELDESMVIVGEAADVDEAIVVVAQMRPDVVLLDRSYVSENA